MSKQRSSASLPHSVPIELEEERDALEKDEMAALDAVGRVCCLLVLDSGSFTSQWIRQPKPRDV